MGLYNSKLAIATLISRALFERERRQPSGTEQFVADLKDVTSEPERGYSGRSYSTQILIARNFPPPAPAPRGTPRRSRVHVAYKGQSTL